LTNLYHNQLLDRREDIQGPLGSGHSSIKTLSLSVPRGSRAGGRPRSQERQQWCQALYGD